MLKNRIIVSLIFLTAITVMPAAEAEHIFEHFVKQDNFKEGLGLGLTFSSAVARRFGGNVMLDTTHQKPCAHFKVVL